MLRRLRLPGKLAVAAIPLVLLIIATTGLVAIQTLDRAEDQDFTAELASMWEPLQSVIDTLESEEAATLAALADLADRNVSAMRGEIDLSAVRTATDESMSTLRRDIESLGDPAPLVRQFEVASEGIVAVRSFFDESGTSPETQRVRIPQGYDLADGRLLDMGDLVVGEVEDVGLGRDLAALAAFSRALQAASVQDRTVELLEENERLRLNLEFASQAGTGLNEALAAYEAAATVGWQEDLAASPVPRAVLETSRMVGTMTRNADEAIAVRDEGWAPISADLRSALSTFQQSRVDSIVSTARADADRVRSEGLLVIGITAGALLLATLVTVLISRSIVKRVRSITDSARDITQTQLPALVEALRDPREDLTLPAIAAIRDRGADEVGDLARSFSAMQSTLEHVASEQVDVLRKGVADMFVTLARRNRSLIDRQLAMIDDLERKEEDAEKLGELYRLDHLATRMRRNAESLLVLAGTEPQKQWTTPLEIDDVVRAALGEVEDYRRIDVLALESVRLRGSAVSDVAHLLSELLENATSFSPPETRVRIAGHFHEGGYLLTVTDRGVGVPAKRLGELNALLAAPPVIGLALEPTLGLYVVAVLAKRHGITVRLVTGAPGLTAQVAIPSRLFEVETDPRPVPAPSEEIAAPDPEPGLTPAEVPPETAAGLPTRTPGVSFSEPDPRRAAVAAGARPPEALKRDLDAFQQGRSAPEGELRSARPSSRAARPSGPQQVANEASSGLPVRPVAETPQETPVVAPTSPPTSPAPAGGPNGLPTRRPGSSYQAAGEGERPVETSHRNPDEIRSAFSSFQLGLTVGRNSIEGEETHE